MSSTKGTTIRVDGAKLPGDLHLWLAPVLIALLSAGLLAAKSTPTAIPGPAATPAGNEAVEQAGLRFLQLAAVDVEFGDRLQAIFGMPDLDAADRDARREALRTLFALHRLAFSNERYDAVMSLYQEQHLKTGEIYQMLRDFETAFGHPNVGVFN